jgi:hypothetical protein
VRRRGRRRGTVYISVDFRNAVPTPIPHALVRPRGSEGEAVGGRSVDTFRPNAGPCGPAHRPCSQPRRPSPVIAIESGAVPRGRAVRCLSQNTTDRRCPPPSGLRLINDRTHQCFSLGRVAIVRNTRFIGGSLGRLTSACRKLCTQARSAQGTLPSLRFSSTKPST